MTIRINILVKLSRQQKKRNSWDRTFWSRLEKRVPATFRDSKPIRTDCTAPLAVKGFSITFSFKSASIQCKCAQSGARQACCSAHLHRCLSPFYFCHATMLFRSTHSYGAKLSCLQCGFWADTNRGLRTLTSLNKHHPGVTSSRFLWKRGVWSVDSFILPLPAPLPSNWRTVKFQ